MGKVFISHASADDKLVHLVQDFLISGIGLRHDEIFCTSVKGAGILAGADFKEYMRQQLEGCDTVLALISPNYYNSPFCMCELGATWMLTKNFIPILIPPVGYKDLRGTLPGLQCLKIVDDSTPDELHDRLSTLTEKPTSVAYFGARKTMYLEQLTEILKGLPVPKTITPQELAKEKAAVAEFTATVIEQAKEIDKLKAIINELATAKDAKEVAVIQVKHSTDWEQFENLQAVARGAYHKLMPAVREALYHKVRGQAWEPDHQEWGDRVTRALEDDLLEEDPHTEYAFWPNEKRPAVRDAVKAVDTLMQFVENDCSYEFSTEAEKKFGDALDLKRRSFFDTMLK